MICGISALVNEVEPLENCQNLNWNKYKVDTESENILEQLAETENKGLRFKIKQNTEGKRTALFRGSLHKEAHGATNTRFTHNDLCEAIKDMRLKYGINPQTTVLRSLEIQMNLFLPFAASGIINRCLIHKKKPFSHLSKTDIHYGKIAVHDKYGVILYGKNKNTLRFGVKIYKMERLKKYGIETLSDLLDGSKVVLLVRELLESAKHIVFWDANANTDNFNKQQLKRWCELGNTTFWETANKSKAYKARNSLKNLSNTLNISDYNTHLENWIKYEWKQLFTSSDLATIEPLLKNGAVTKVTFAHIDKGCKGRPNKCSINEGDLKNINQETNKETSKPEALTEIRFCTSCGRDISIQRKGSKYCSAKYVGEEQAKKCRNKARNRKGIKLDL